MIPDYDGEDTEAYLHIINTYFSLCPRISRIPGLLSRLDVIQKANCVVAIAGMEGALASVLGGLVKNPVIACPTSVGYGASFHGLSALLAMLNSCAAGVAVMNIDNGFGAGVLASKINHMR